MLEILVEYLIKYLNPGIILIFIAVLYIYISSLNRLMEIIITKQDLKELDDDLSKISKNITQISANLNLILTQITDSINKNNTAIDMLKRDIESLENIANDLKEIIGGK